MSNDGVSLKFKQMIASYSKNVFKNLTNQHTLQDARDCVPISEIVQENLELLDDETYYKDNLLPHLVNWFSGTFFKWFQPPKCDKCSVDCVPSSSSGFQNPERNLVERYQCQNDTCNYTYDFIRHNDPAILIHTRQGRCGEWANCFSVILKSLDYEVRLVLDTTDHVWNEVWSIAKSRWLHVDPCESVIDQPLLYEVGWGKKLKYCFAFSELEVVDVTPRYTVNYMKTIVLRLECDENTLAKYIEELYSQMVLSTDPQTRFKILSRFQHEVSELEKLRREPRQLGDLSHLSGRKTGTMEWRIARGEYSPIQTPGHVVHVSRKSKHSKEESSGVIFYLKYDCDEDKYLSSDDDYNCKTWSSLINESENIDFKYERDWKTSYLSRYESCRHDLDGNIKWKFDLTKLVQWSKLTIMIQGKLYPSTEIQVKMIVVSYSDDSGSEDKTTIFDLELNKLNEFNKSSFDDSAITTIILQATLRGGVMGDSVAWQKPQLFRQVRGEPNGVDKRGVFEFLID